MEQGFAVNITKESKMRFKTFKLSDGRYVVECLSAEKRLAEFNTVEKVMEFCRCLKADMSWDRAKELCK
jgi:hypothetical protein